MINGFLRGRWKMLRLLALLVCVAGGLVVWGQEPPELKVDPGALKSWRVVRASYQAQEADVPGGKPGETWTRQRWLWSVTGSTVKYYWPEWGYFELSPDQYSAVCVVRAEPVPWDVALTAGETVTCRWRVRKKDLANDVGAPVTAVLRGRDAKGVELVVPVHTGKLAQVSRAGDCLVLQLPGGYEVVVQEPAVRGLRGKLP